MCVQAITGHVNHGPTNACTGLCLDFHSVSTYQIKLQIIFLHDVTRTPTTSMLADLTTDENMNEITEVSRSNLENVPREDDVHTVLFKQGFIQRGPTVLFKTGFHTEGALSPPKVKCMSLHHKLY